MKYAAAVGAAGYSHFTELNVCLLRKVFGADLDIVIRDDPSPDSARIEQMAAKRDCFYRTTASPLGHFGGDVQTFIDALALAEAVDADIAIKVSQRFMVVGTEVRPIVQGRFTADPNLLVVMPGRPNPNFIRQGHQQFARFPILTDIVFMRADKKVMTPELIKGTYEAQLRGGTQYADTFVEVFWDKLRHGVLKDRVHLAPELTDHRGGQPPLFFRRYQNRPEEYKRAAMQFGITGEPWELGERAKMTRGYNPVPRMV